MKTQKILTLALFLALAFAGQSQNQNQKKPKPSNSEFKGLWILDKYEIHDSLTGKWSTESSRMGYSGYILFDGLGHMAIQITPADYVEFEQTKKNDSLGKKVVANFHSNNLIYFAEYKIEGNQIDNQVISSTNPESIGAILTRDFEFKGKTLLLTPKNKLNGSKIRMKWVKVQ